MANVTSSVLNDIKKLLGLSADYKVFDMDVTIHINSAFSTLQQLGVGPDAGFMIYSDATTWSTFLTADDFHLNAVKTYVYLRVRLLFDPPGTAYLVNAITDQIRELEWRLNVAVESRMILPPIVVPPIIIPPVPVSDPTAIKGRLGVDWLTANPLLRKGEPGMELETSRLKIGDGVTRWNDLPYITDNTPIPVETEFEFVQTLPAATWIISHTFGRLPLVDVYVDGEQVEADVDVTDTTVTVIFPDPTAGSAVLS